MGSFDDILNELIDNDKEEYLGQETKTDALMVQQGIQACEFYNETHKSIDVVIQDNTNVIIWGYLHKTVNETPYSLASDVTIDTYTLEVTDATGLVAGDRIGIFQDNDAEFFNILSVATNTLTLDTPICCGFTAGCCSIFELSREMAVDGSTTAQKFVIDNESENYIDITGLHFCLASVTEPDMISFGDITALTRGVVLRVKRANGEYEQITNIKCNGDFGSISTPDSLKMYYEDTAQSYNGVTCRIALAGSQNFGSTIRLAKTEIIEILIQDDLTGLTNFRATYFGHIVD